MARSELGRAYDILLRLPSLTHPGRALREAFASLAQGVIRDHAWAEELLGWLRARVERQQAKLKALQERQDQVVVKVRGLAGPLCVVHCDAGSTIYHVKRRLHKELGTALKQQELVYDTQKLEDKDILRWFPPVVDDVAVVQLSLIVKPESEAAGWSEDTIENFETEPAEWEVTEAKAMLRGKELAVARSKKGPSRSSKRWPDVQLRMVCWHCSKPW